LGVEGEGGVLGDDVVIVVVVEDAGGVVVGACGDQEV
jgi:hypothetical protein